MRLPTSLLFALPTIAIAEEQIPLGKKAEGWFNKAKSYVPAGVKSPIAASSARIAAQAITPLTRENWESELTITPSNVDRGPETWLVLITGGNKTCGGRCTRVEEAFNETAALLLPDPSSPKLGYLNCESNAVLCNIWAASVPTLWHIQIPIPAVDQSAAGTTIRIINVNTTTITTQEIVQIHTQKSYEKVPVYHGAFHPFDGYLAKFQLNKAIGYVLFAFSLVPSWAFMIFISMVSRNFM